MERKREGERTERKMGGERVESEKGMFSVLSVCIKVVLCCRMNLFMSACLSAFFPASLNCSCGFKNKEGKSRDSYNCKTEVQHII